MLAHELVSPYNESTTEEESAMADQQHLDRLRQGVSTWNAWREEQQPEFRPDLSGAHLIRANLSFADLSGANLSGADLFGADLSDANLSGALQPHFLNSTIKLEQDQKVRAPSSDISPRVT
jgi:hypothetical protein